MFLLLHLLDLYIKLLKQVTKYLNYFSYIIKKIYIKTNCHKVSFTVCSLAFEYFTSNPVVHKEQCAVTLIQRETSAVLLQTHRSWNALVCIMNVIIS